MKLIEELCSAIVEWCWVSWRWVHWQPQSTYGLEWTSVLACSIVPLGWDFVEVFTFLCGHTYNELCTCNRELRDFLTRKEFLCPTSPNTPLSCHRSAFLISSSPWGPSYAVCIHVRSHVGFETSNCRLCFKAGVCIVAVFYRFFYKMTETFVSDNSGICRYKFADLRALLKKLGTYWGVFRNYMQ